MFIDLERVSYREHIDRSCLFIYLATLSFLIGEFSTFTFKVIIKRYALIAILLIAFGCCIVFPCSFLFLFVSSLEDFGLMILFLFLMSHSFRVLYS